MKNKGIAISGILFSILIMFIILLLSILGLVGSRKVMLDKIKKDVAEELGAYSTNEEYHFGYTGSPQELTIANTGDYVVELWGASGGGTNELSKGVSQGGKGSYTRGIIRLERGQKIYIYVGEGGIEATLTNLSDEKLYSAKWNGGGSGGKDTAETELTGEHGFSGGGATDIRIIGGNWNNIESLRSRIMVAAGGGGGGWSGNGNADQYYADGGGNGGNLEGGIPINSTSYVVGKQTSGSNFGFGGNGIFGTPPNNNATGGGGGGYYGGSQGISFSKLNSRGAGGSSYISGHIGSVAVTSQTSTTPKSGCTDGTTNENCSIHYSNLKFSDTLMIDGSNEIVTPTGQYSIGNVGNGYAKITRVDGNMNDIVKRYVTNGLKTYYDGINNTGTGNNPTSTIWRDLAGNSNGSLQNFSFNQISGWDGKGLVFDGIDDGVSLSNNLRDLLKSNNTIEVAIKFNGVERDIIIGNYNVANSVNFEKTLTNKARLYFNSGAADQSSSDNLPIGTPMTLTYLYNKPSGQVVVKLNGVQFHTFTMSQIQSYNLNWDSVWLGRDSRINDTTPLNGTIYSFRVYDRLLQDSEINNNHEVDKKKFGF